MDLKTTLDELAVCIFEVCNKEHHVRMSAAGAEEIWALIEAVGVSIRRAAEAGEL